jgi:hypothetical protein
MTELSPAQKTLAAFNDRYELCGPFDDDWVEQCLAAAIRSELLAIAAELRGGTTTETP